MTYSEREEVETVPPVWRMASPVCRHTDALETPCPQLLPAAASGRSTFPGVGGLNVGRGTVTEL